MHRRKFLTGLATMSALLLKGCSLPHASDETMIAWFSKNQDRFNRLIEMARSEPDVRRIAPDFLKTEDDETFYYPQLPKSFSLERWKAYLKLFEDLDLEMGIEFWSLEEIWLYATTLGIAVSGSTKGYVWSSRPVGPLVNSLDDPLPAEGRMGGNDYIAFRAIAPSWYLVYEET